ncbi:MAG: AraC family transcriptional regulator [Crocinitomicaceae bacterium]|nr:AraC family transcriptional regulator [Crocinitomicaceae bacterium]|tara:strand:- start:9390 stop:10376 length:987 start_codon:yes stop_codon:yes gene_type:complete
MKRISIIVPNGQSVLSSIIGPFKVFSEANRYLVEVLGKEAFFSIQLVGLGKDQPLYGGAFSVNPQAHIQDVKKTDMVIIPAIFGDFAQEIENNSPYIPWIKEQYRNGAEVASLCMGAFILASTGLLKGQKCTTHWFGIEPFKVMFPDVEVVGEKIITESNGLYSSGGAYSFLNLILYIVEKYCGREVALHCAKFFEIEIDRFSQSHFSIFKGQKVHNDEAVLQTQGYIEHHFKKKISVDELAEMCNVSRRSFIRRFKAATDNTPIEYVQRVRIEAAKKLLESSNENVNEVMFEVGYSDAKTFRNLFKKMVGLSPVQYRSKYNRMHAVA